MRGFSVGLAAAAMISSISAASLDPIVIKGSKFFYKTNGTQFFMKGVAYQEDFNGAVTTASTGSDDTTAQFTDPLADPTGCARDIPLMQALGMNTIRVYAIDTSKDHTQCMTMLNNAGIYVVADLSEPGLSINRDEPSWDLALYNRYTSVVDAMANYTNVLGFFAGNEVTNNNTNTDASPFVKAAIRDMKSYIKSKSYRAIPIGYATNDASDIRNDLADYFNCGDKADAIDFWGYNIYSWCDPSDIKTSGWDIRTEEYANYSVPVFFAEYGCNTNRPRTWGEVTALYGDVMSPVFSGGIVYMYFEEANKYGLVQVTNGKATKLPDYNNLQKVLPNVRPDTVQSANYNPTNTAARACPTADENWAGSTVLPPTPDTDLCGCMVKSLGCVAQSNVDIKDFGELFGYICDKVDSRCAGITANGTTGNYGAYSGCQPRDRLSWAMNDYFTQFSSQGSAACNFDSRAKTQTASTDGTCKNSISSAGGLAGTSTAAAGSGGSNGNKTNAASPMAIPSLSIAAISAITVLITAFAGGISMIVL